MMLTIADNPCSVCRGEATTSDARCQCTASTVNIDSSSALNHRTRCVNCGVLSTTSPLCARCDALPRCRRCKRHLPRQYFRQLDSRDDDDDDDDDDDGGGDDERSHLCHACDRRRGRPTVRRSTDSIVTEINIPLGDAAYNSFDTFVAAHQDQLRQYVEEYRQLHRYVILLCSGTVTLTPDMNLVITSISLTRSLLAFRRVDRAFFSHCHVIFT